MKSPTFKVKDMDLATGGPLVIVLNQQDAQELDLHHKDRVLIRKASNKRIKTVAILDIAESEKAVPQGEVGVLEEVLDKLHLRQGTKVLVEYARKPASVTLIRRKLDGYELTQDEYDQIISDVVRDELTEGELTYFVAACYIHGLTDAETVRLTESIVEHGEHLELRGSIFDKHCIGGVPGNRTTMVVVPIVAAAGLRIPKTSSRAITSPAGTADTMEVLAPVKLSLRKMRSVIKRVGACIAWGGGINLAAADDKLIKVRHTMSIDPRGMLLASILAKKKAVDSNKVLIDIPIGQHTKIKTQAQARRLKQEFIRIGKRLHMEVEVVTTNGEEPIGKGIGPILEARDVLYILRRDPLAPKDLERKSLEMAASLLRLAGRKDPDILARKLLESGKAYEKFKEIIKAQGGKPNIKPEDLQPGKHQESLTAYQDGLLIELNTRALAHVARLAGAPLDKGAGMYLHHHEGEEVKKGEPILTLYAESKAKLQFAMSKCEGESCFMIK